MLFRSIAFNFNIEDGVRDTDAFFRQSVHEKLSALYQEVGINYSLVIDDFEVFSEMSTIINK